MIDKIADILINSFDYGYMFSVNILTYLIIKTVDYLNGDKIVPQYAKRLIAVISGIILGVIIILSNIFSHRYKIRCFHIVIKNSFFKFLYYIFITWIIYNII